MKKKSVITFTIIIVVALIAIISYQTISAYYSDKDQVTNKFKVGELEVQITEPNYEDNQTVSPGDEISKDPTFSNIGGVDGYIRAQLYVPISNNVKYVDENENVVTPSQEIELVTYQINEGWELITTDGYSGVYEDESGNKYNVYTYKYVENGQEKLVNAGGKIDTPLFNSVKVINYLDIDQNTNIQVHVSALAVQSDGGTADEMWTYYMNQNGTGIVGVE